MKIDAINVLEVDANSPNNDSSCIVKRKRRKKIWKSPGRILLHSNICSLRITALDQGPQFALIKRKHVLRTN